MVDSRKCPVLSFIRKPDPYYISASGDSLYDEGSTAPIRTQSNLINKQKNKRFF